MKLEGTIRTAHAAGTAWGGCVSTSSRAWIVALRASQGLFVAASCALQGLLAAVFSLSNTSNCARIALGER